MKKMLLSFRFLAFCLVLVVFSSVLPAHAQGGKLSFTSSRDGEYRNYLMNADGSGQTRLTSEGYSNTREWSPDGSHIVFESNRDGHVEIYVMNADGTGQTRLTVTAKGEHLRPRWSPDGSRIAFSYNDGTQTNIYVMNADGSGRTRLTSEGRNYDANWSPDGSRIAFSSARNAQDGIYIMNADGTGQTRLTSEGTWEPRWSPSGHHIAYYFYSNSQAQIYVMNADGKDQTPLTVLGSNTQHRWSPDGRQLAFESDRDGHREIYVMDANGTAQTRLTYSTAGERIGPEWSPDGSRIAFDAYVPDEDRRFQIYIMNADGTSQNRLTNEGENFDPQWQPKSYPTAAVSIAVITPVHNTAIKSLVEIKGTVKVNAGSASITKVKAFIRRKSGSGSYEYWARRNGVWGWDFSISGINTVLDTSGTWRADNASPEGTQLPASMNLPTGSYQFFATAVDESGKTTTSEVNKVTVDSTAPTTIEVTSPAHNSVIKSLPLIQGVAGDAQGGSGITRVVAYLRRLKPGTATTYEYWSKRNGMWNWGNSNSGINTMLSGRSWSVSNHNSTYFTILPSGPELPTGSYQLYAYAYDKAGNHKISSINKVTVDNIVPSSVVVTSPSKNATISSVTVIKGTASDATGGSGIARVDAFFRRGPSGSYQYWAKRNGAWGWGNSVTSITTVLIGRDWRVDNTAPSGTIFPSGSASLPSGKYQVFAKAYDKAENTLLSAIHTITVVAAENETNPEKGTSSVVLSSASAGASNSTILLVFSGELETNTSADPTHYSVKINGVDVSIERVRVASTTSVVLAMHEGSIHAGEVAVISYSIMDGKGNTLAGTAKVAVK